MKIILKFQLIILFITGCATPTPQREPSSRDAQMISDVSNMSCLSRRGSASNGSALQISHQGAKRAEKALINNLSASLIHFFGEATARRVFGGVKIVFKNSMTNSSGGCLPGHQLVAGEVHMARRCPDGYQFPNADAILVHELGHFAANKLNLYPSYERAVPQRCQVSRYSTRMSSGKAIAHRREEFAEAFAAYLTATDRLRSECPDAYHFMKELFNNTDYDCSAKR